MLNIMNPPADWSTMKKLIWLRGTPINGGEDLTVTGTPPLTLPNSLGKPLKAWEVDVLPKQDLNGYDAPWPAGAGKNKLDLEAYVKSLRQDGYSVDSDGWVTIDDLGASPNFYHNTWPVGPFTNGSVLIEIDTTRTTAINPRISILDNGTTVAESASTISNNAFDTIRFNWSTNGSLTARVSVVAESTITAWSPYSNICPIHGTDKVNLFVEESYDQSATPKAVLALPQTVYTATISEQGGESRSSYRTFAELGADTRWSRLTSGTFAFYLSRIFALQDCSFPIPELPFSTHYKYSQSGTMQNGTFRISDALYIVDDRFETIGDFRAWLSSTDGGIWYRSEPTTFSVPSVTIPTPTGTATAWATAEDGTVESMEVTYVGKA